MKTKSASASKSKGNGSTKHEDERDTLESAPSSQAGSLEQMIAEEAYFLAEQRGFAPENDLADWLQAEANVKARLSCSQ